ncbi:monooxygenase 1-like isoform X3 [Actinidia eriantha]|uniref:monooxygenase 1-like isoform X3 n=1 Tax=Actinidia eriantha TaxID=165200 RepID=UPI002585D145|nr:monooxygenase 1-like isoform X3 [Actinidia eriantha]
MDEIGREEEHEIVIVGGGICGLATALALHRFLLSISSNEKGMKSVVLERSERLRANGAAIGIQANGWRALHQLGVASILRQTALPLQGSGESRCVKRTDLINTLAGELPPGTIHFGCEIASVKLDHLTSCPILQLHDGGSIVAKVLIGCDGAKSVVADFLGIKPTKEFASSAVRGLTNHPNGHGFAHEFVRMRKNNILIGRIPIDDKIVYWFVGLRLTPEDHAKISQHPKHIIESTLKSIRGFPNEIMQMIENSELESLSFTHLRYRAPWDLLLGNFRKGTITVAGDSMHVMGPFLGQGGSAGLEDAIVLARCLSQKLGGVNLITSESEIMMRKVGEAMDQYVEERRMRVLWLSTQTYLTGLLLQPSSLLVKFACIVFMVVLFRNPTDHSRYDCGHL